MIERSINFLLALISAGLVVLFWPTKMSPGHSVPPKSELTSYSGTLASWKNHSTRINNDIEYRIVESKLTYIYNSKGGGKNAILPNFKVGATISSLGKYNTGNFIRKNPNSISVYEISINGRTIRSYEETKEAWTDDDKLSPFLIALFALGFLLFLAQGITGRNFTQKKQ